MTTDAIIKTREVYNSSPIVAHYARATELQPAERTIFSLLAAELPQMQILDIGVGGGRTTRHLASAAQRYVGVDFSAEMIAACRRAFPETDSIQFQVADACDLREFGSESFDLVLFSFNGIDCIPLRRRHDALLEMTRVLRPGGYLVFSAHNINYLPKHKARLRPKLSRNPRRMARGLKRYLWFQIKNRFAAYGPALKETVVFDGAEQFGVPFVYIRPDEQQRRLAELGLLDVRVFGSDSGEEYNVSQAAVTAEPWAYFLCAKPGQIESGL